MMNRFRFLPIAMVALATVFPAVFSRAADKMIGIEVKDGIKVVYHIKVGDVGEDGVSKGVAELRHLVRLYDEQGVTRDKRKINAVFDADGVPFVVSDATYSKLGKGEMNASAPLIAELIKEGVEIDVCGQRMKRDEITETDLLPGVRTALGGQLRVIDLELRGFAYFRF